MVGASLGGHKLAGAAHTDAATCAWCERRGGGAVTSSAQCECSAVPLLDGMVVRVILSLRQEVRRGGEQPSARGPQFKCVHESQLQSAGLRAGSQLSHRGAGSTVTGRSDRDPAGEGEALQEALFLVRFGREEGRAVDSGISGGRSGGSVEEGDAERADRKDSREEAVEGGGEGGEGRGGWLSGWRGGAFLSGILGFSGDQADSTEGTGATGPSNSFNSDGTRASAAPASSNARTGRSSSETSALRGGSAHGRSSALRSRGTAGKGALNSAQLARAVSSGSCSVALGPTCSWSCPSFDPLPASALALLSPLTSLFSHPVGEDHRAAFRLLSFPASIPPHERLSVGQEKACTPNTTATAPLSSLSPPLLSPPRHVVQSPGAFDSLPWLKEPACRALSRLRSVVAHPFVAHRRASRLAAPGAFVLHGGPASGEHSQGAIEVR